MYVHFPHKQRQTDCTVMLVCGVPCAVSQSVDQEITTDCLLLVLSAWEALDVARTTRADHNRQGTCG